MVQGTVQVKSRFLQNIKSNVVLAALLFVLMPTASIASWPVADTIIIDGDTIYIEKRERTLNVDSLQEEANDDVITKRIPQHRFSMALNMGWNSTIGTFQSAYESYQPLDNFIDRKNSHKGNISPSLDIGIRFWGTVMEKGELHLSVHSGIQYNEINIFSSQMDQSPFAHDSIFQLMYLDSQLQLEYFNIFDTTDQGIIGELDTAIVKTEQSLNYFQTWDIPFKLRATYLFPNTQISLFAEAGVIYRVVQSSGQTKRDNYLVNAKAEFRRFEKNLFQPDDIITPIFSVGSNYHLSEKGLAEKHWSIHVAATVTLPSRALNPEAFYILQARSFMLSAGLRRTF